jgi:NAD-specific glutamate dehydrogenase
MTAHTSQPISSDLINTLSSLLTDADVEILSLLSHPLRPTERFSLEGYVQALFARASSDFARMQRPEDVYRIVSGSLRAIGAIASQPDRIVLNFSLAEDTGALFIALDDHPFIISSLAETLSDADIRVDAFLHPVVLFRGAPIASSFIEVHTTAIDRAPPLLPRLREMLRNLTRVGGDAVPLIVAVRKGDQCRVVPPVRPSTKPL